VVDERPDRVEEAADGFHQPSRSRCGEVTERAAIANGTAQRDARRHRGRARPGRLSSPSSSERPVRIDLRVAFAAVPAVTLAVIAIVLATGLLAVGFAFRVNDNRGWNALGVFAAGGVIAGYGLLYALLTGDSWPVIAVGTAIAGGALGYLWSRAP